MAAYKKFSFTLMAKSHVPGLCGLLNLGNTCYMNSTLQCLSNVPALTNYFLHDGYKKHINRDNPLGMKGDVAQAYGELIHEIWSGKIGSYAPKSLKQSVARYAPQFSDYAQQDSQEFMSFLFDGLHEDLNRVKQKPYIDKKDDDGKATDTKLAEEQWDYYLKRNQSKIQDIFHGQIKSIVQCHTCKTIERIFEPIYMFSLPLPGKKTTRTYKIQYIRLNGEMKCYSIKSNENGHMLNLVEEFCRRFQPKVKNVRENEPMEADSASALDINKRDAEEEEQEDFTKAPDYDGHQPKPDFILTAEVYNNRIHLQYSDTSLLTNILERDQIVFYEVPDSLKQSNSDKILMPCVFQEENTRQNFGYPIYISIPRRDCRGKDIQEALQKTIGNFLPLSSTDSSDKPLYTAYCIVNRNYNQSTKKIESFLDDRFEFNRANVSVIVDVTSPIVEKYEKKQESKERYGIEANVQSKQSTTLADCFKHFTNKEILSSDNLWNCSKCKEMKRASKKIDIWLLPKVLIVQLKRFNYDRNVRVKNDIFVDCPLDNLDLSQFVLNPAEKAKAKYELIGVSNHMDGLDGEHYTAHTKNVNDGKWHTFDDALVTKVNENNVISKAVYILIYQRRD